MRRLFTPALVWLAVLATAMPSDAGLRIRSISDGVARGDLGSGIGAPLAIARTALARVGPELGVDGRRFRFESVRRSVIGVHVRGREFRGGVPVDGTSAAVHIVDGTVVQVEARPTGLPGRPVTSPISLETAIAAGLGAVGLTDAEAVQAEHQLAAHGDRLVDTFHVTVFSLSPALAVEIDVSASDGRVLSVRDNRLHLDGSATVFDPNPIVSTKNNALRTPGVDQSGADTDLDSAELTAARVMLPVKSFELAPLATGKLLGPYVEVQGPAPLDVDGVFEYTRGDPRFETTMAYAHIDRLQRYMQELGFVGDAAVNAEPQNVYTLPVLGFDNSFYQPGNDLMLFGAGGVDDGEDAEVILHELGHAIHDAQVPGWGDTHQGGSMGEGWGDFLAAAYYARTISGGFQDECVADWDATSYSEQTPPCLRRTDEDKQYPDDMEDEVHADGEIWSAFLWTLRSELGCPAEIVEGDTECGTDRAPESVIQSDRVLKLVLTSHELLTTTADFGDAVAALILAAESLDRPEWVPIITSSAEAFGLPLA